MKAQVLLPKVFNFPFTYNSREHNKIGNLVEVPFGSKKEIGVIWKNNYSEPQNIKVKDISNQTQYSIDKKLIDFIEWFSNYNMVPIGLVLKMAIGSANKFIRINDSPFKIKVYEPECPNGQPCICIDPDGSCDDGDDDWGWMRGTIEEFFCSNDSSEYAESRGGVLCKDA